jgi:hypothetical protein
MNIYKALETSILDLLKSKIKMKALTKDQINQIVASQISDVDNIVKTISAFDKTAMHGFYDKYYQHQFDKSNKNDVGYIIPNIGKLLTKGALVAERDQMFGATKLAGITLLKILSEVRKGIDKLVPGEAINMFDCSISNVMLLGILRETDLYIKYTQCVWDHFLKTCVKQDSTVIGYRADFMKKHMDEYAKILNNAVNKDRNYSFLKDVAALKQKNQDLLLYANNRSFLDFFSPSSLTGTASHYLEQGVIGFNFLTGILSLWDDWMHSRYIKNKDFKEWLETSVTLLRMNASGVDPNSPEYQKLMKIIDAYDKAITDVDRKIAAYEKE